MSSSEPLRKPWVMVHNMSPRAVEEAVMDSRSRARAETGHTSRLTADVAAMPKTSISSTCTILVCEKTLV